MSEKIVTVTMENFEEEVINSDKTVLVDFWAPWCGPCRMIAPTIEEIAEEYENFKICKVNVDEQPDLAEQFNVRSIPTLAVIREKQIVNIAIGVKPKQSILALMA